MNWKLKHIVWIIALLVSSLLVISLFSAKRSFANHTKPDEKCIPSEMINNLENDSCTYSLKPLKEEEKGSAVFTNARQLDVNI